MASNSASDSSSGARSPHAGVARATDSPPGLPAAAGSDPGNDDSAADRTASPDKGMGTIIVAIGMALFGIFWMIAASNIPNKTGFGSLGPGFLPFWAGLILTLIAGGHIVGTVRKRIGTRAAVPTSSHRLLDAGQLRVAGTLAALLLYIIFLPLLHFFINTFLLSAAGLALCGVPLKPRLLVIAALISGVLFAIFIYWLEIPLPGSRIFG